MLNLSADKEIKLILGIDTSCDDTSVAVTYGSIVLSNVISSQIEMHRKWGGTVPGLARRMHEERIDHVIDEALNQARKNLKSCISRLGENEAAKLRKYTEKLTIADVDAIAVTQGPGLAIALEVGVEKAKDLAKEYGKPLIPIDHMEAHLLSPLAERMGVEGFVNTKEQIFPGLGVLVSGGHTQLILVNGVGEYEIIGETLDDAIGEAFDKVARILNLGYPGGVVIEEFAKQGDKTKFDLPVAMKGTDNFDLSYSGLKTAVLYLVRDLEGGKRVQEKMKRVSWKHGMIEPETPFFEESSKLDRQTICDICASFQEAATETLVNKIRKALRTYKVKNLLLGGGVTNNLELRKKLLALVKNESKTQRNEIKLLFPYSIKLFQDNGAMIANAAYLKLQADKATVLESTDEIDSLDRDPGLRLG